MKFNYLRHSLMLLGFAVLSSQGTADENETKVRTEKKLKTPAKSVVIYLPANTKEINASVKPKFDEKGNWLVRKGVVAEPFFGEGRCFIESGGTLRHSSFRMIIVKKGGTLSHITQGPQYLYQETGAILPEDFDDYRSHLKVEEFASLTFSPWQPFTLKGRVRDAAGDTRAGIKVHAYGLEEQQIAEAVTDSQGAFAFRPSEQVKCLAADLGEAWYKYPSYSTNIDLEMRRRLGELRGWEAVVQEGYWGGRDIQVSLSQSRPATVTLPKPSVLLAHEMPICDLRFSADGATLATLSDAGWPCVWDRERGEEICRFVPHSRDLLLAGKLQLHERQPRLSALDARGQVLGFFGPTGQPSLWDVRAGRQIHLLKVPDCVSCAVFAPDGRTLAAGGADDAIRLWDVNSGALRTIIKAHQKRVDALVFSPDGKELLSMGAVEGDSPNDPSNIYDRMRVWDAATGAAVRTFDAEGEQAVFSADGELLATVTVPKEGARYRNRGQRGAAERSPIRIWERSRRRWIGKVAAQADVLALTPDNQLLVTATADRIQFWEILTGQEILTCPLPEKDVSRLALSADSRTLAVGKKDGLISLWSIRAPRLYVPQPRPSGAGEREQLWRDLASEHAAVAYRALWTLLREPEQTAALLQSRLVPAPALPLEKWIGELDKESFPVRENARNSLRDSGEPAERALREILKEKPSLEVRKQAEQIIAEIELQNCSAEQLRSLRAIQLLEEIGSPKARAILQALAKGWSAARQTREAKAALKRLR